MSTDDERHRAVVDGAAWAEFCDQLKSMGQVVVDNSEDDLDRLEGFRYLSRLTRGGLQNFIENSATPFSRILPIPHNLKIGCDNPDAYYQNVAVDPAFDYRVHGPRGTVNFLSVGAYSGGYTAGAAKPGAQGHITDNDPDAKAIVDIIASAKEPDRLQPGQRWLRMEAETTTLIIRNFYLDRLNETPSQLQLDCINPPGPGPGPLTSKQLGKGLMMAGFYVQGVTELFLEWLRKFKERPNTLEFVPDDDDAGQWGDPNQLFRHGYWALEPGQAIVIDVPAIDAYYWNFQLNNMWEESLDYQWLPVTVNKHTVVYRPDGSARLIVAASDPGHDNWIDTAHHSEGTWGLRYNQVVEDIAPKITVVDAADLES